MPDTTFRPADTDNDILRKILAQYGGVYSFDDFDNTLYRKILTQLGGVFRPGDGTSELLRKIATRVGAVPRPGDTTNKLLYRIDQSLSNDPKPGDYDNILLRKWLNPDSIIPPTPGTVIEIIPKVNPQATQAAVTVNITGADSYVGKWLGFWVSEKPQGTPFNTHDYVFVVAQLVTAMPFTITFNIPVPTFSPATVCVMIKTGPTQASVSSGVSKGRTTCFAYPQEFLVVNLGSAPNAPVAIAASAITATSFSANWNASTGDPATSYRLDVSTSNLFGSFVPGYNNLNVGNVLTQSVTGLTPGTVYYYRIRGVNAFGTSGNSNIISQIELPDAPVATAATSLAETSFAANWGAVTGATSYRLDVSTVNTFVSFVSGFNDLNVGNVVTASVTGLTASTTYYFRVRAVDASGTSANSNTITAITIAAAPVATAATNVTDVTFSANWGAVSGATSYRLDVSTSNVFGSFVSGYNDLNVGNVVTAAVTGLTQNTTYYFRVRAVSGSGASGNSNTITTLTYFTETLDWVTRVIANSGTVSQGTKDAANTFLVAVNSAGLRSLIYRLNLYAGTGLGACKTPLIKDQGNATDTLANFVSGDYSEATGLTGNTTNKFVQTGFVPSTMGITTSNGGLGAYVRSNFAEASVILGSNTSGVGGFYILARYGSGFPDGSQAAMCGASSVANYTPDTTSLGWYQGSRTASNVLTLYKNGVSVATTSVASATPPSPSCTVHSYTDSLLSVVQFCSKTLAGYFFGAGMNATQQLAFYNAWQAFQTALGRQV